MRDPELLSQRSESLSDEATLRTTEGPRRNMHDRQSAQTAADNGANDRHGLQGIGFQQEGEMADPGRFERPTP
ncbi:hypothetical protein BMI91_03780 [Thioclava sediminum]|uniref:Uncharacterized protein n=1 Tax=Thioclava sediminum TaxID=1915319 RepID=A0ABX3N109_9RHOB|nr:hypothetical protein BMI91_03780 [Thioclava sediminum]